MIFSLIKGKKDEENDSVVSNDLKKTKEDLSSDEVKKPRKKKEQPRPWGKRDRILILIILLLTVGTSMFLAMSSRGWKLPGFPRMNVPNLSFFKEETIVIKKEEAISPKSKDILSELEAVTDGLSGVYGVKVIDLKSDSQINLYSDEEFPAASLVKLPVMAAMLQESEFGNINLDEEYTLKSTDKIPGAGSLYYKPDGYVVTYGEMVRLMGKESDNTAFGICRNLLGDEKISKVQEQFGMYNTSLKDNVTTPSDIASFYKKIYKGDILTKPNNDLILEYLTDTAYEKWLKPGLPEDVKLSHKYGTVPGTVNDAGIVFAEYPYVIVVVSKGVVEREANNIFPEISKIIYDNMQSFP